MQLGDGRNAAAAYERAYTLAPDIENLQGLAGAFVTDGKPGKAVDAVKAARDQVTKTAGASTAADLSLASSSRSTSSPSFGVVEADLLLGRVYSQWPGHDSEALATYDAIIQQSPDDFR